MKYKVKLEVFDRKAVDYALAMVILSMDVENDELREVCAELSDLFLDVIEEQVDAKRIEAIGDTIKRSSCK